MTTMLAAAFHPSSSVAKLASIARCARTPAVQQLRYASLFKQLVDKTRPSIKEMDPKEAWENRDKFTFVDVREDREWMSKGVLGVDKLYLVERGVLERELPKCVPDTSTPLMVYCAGAMRSVLATRSLNELGYTDVTSLNGGFDGWKEENLPLKSYNEWRACQDGKDE